MISFIVPAHNEELWIGKCLGSIHATMEQLAEPYEVIVVDDASTDSTQHAGEDIAFVQALKKVGRFVVLKPKVLSSGRKLNVVTPWEVIGLMLTIAIRGSRYENKWVLDILYGRRAQDSKKPDKAD